MSVSSWKAQKGITFTPQITVPTSPTSGDVYFDSTYNTYAYYQNGFWSNLASKADVTSAASLTSTQFTAAVVQNSLVRVTGSTNSTLHGLTASSGSKTLVIYNQGTGSLTIMNQSGTEPTAANRINTPGANTLVLSPGQVVQLTYDDTATAWFIFGIVGKVTYAVSTDSTTTGSDATLAAFTSGIVRLTNGSLISVGGIPAGVSGQSLIIENQTGNPVLIRDEDLTATSTNRIRTGLASDTTLDINQSFMFVYDSTAGRWFTLNAPANTAASIPSGATLDFAGSVTPAGWFLCDGSAVSRTTYSALFTAIGTAYGVGDGSTTFNVPDFRGRAVIGSGTGSGLTARSRGQTGGEETHLLSTAEMPSHTHTQNPHYHRGEWDAFAGSGAPGGGIWSHGRAYSDSNGGADKVIENTTATNNNTGGGGSHNNMQPFGVATKIIKQ